MLRATLALLLLAATPALARNWAKAACEDDYSSCQEDCTIADGTELDAQGRLERCLDRCRQDAQHCVFLRLEARRKAQQQIAAPASQVAADSSAALRPTGTATAPTPAAPPAPVAPPIAPRPPAAPLTAAPSTATAPASSTSASSRRAATRLAIDQSFESGASEPAPAPRAPPLPAPQPSAQLYTGSARRPVVRAPDYDRLGSGPTPASEPHAATPVASTPSGSDTDALLDRSAHETPPPAKKKPKQRKDLSQWDPQDLE